MKSKLFFAFVFLCILFSFSYALTAHKNSLQAPPLGEDSPYLEGVLDSVVADLDATISASYTAGETWANLTITPADGTDNTDHDYWLGVDGDTDGDEPTFNGSPGDAGAYWILSANTGFAQKVAPTGMLKDMHKNDVTSWWICACFKSGTYSGSEHSGIFGTTGNAWEDGIRLSYINNLPAIRLNRVSGAANQQTFNPLDKAVSEETDYILIVSFNKDDQTLRSWVNSRTVTETEVDGVITGADDATWKYGIGVGGTSNGTAFANIAKSGERIYSLAYGNEFLDDTKVELIIDHLNARHERTYVE